MPSFFSGNDCSWGLEGFHWRTSRKDLRNWRLRPILWRRCHEQNLNEIWRPHTPSLFQISTPLITYKKQLVSSSSQIVTNCSLPTRYKPLLFHHQGHLLFWVFKNEIKETWFELQQKKILIISLLFKVRLFYKQKPLSKLIAAWTLSAILATPKSWEASQPKI